jgi:hypothetical protein
LKHSGFNDGRCLPVEQNKPSLRSFRYRPLRDLNDKTICSSSGFNLEIAIMKKLILSAFAAAAIGGLSVGAASAMPFGSAMPTPGAGLVHEARIVCDRNGRCYNTNRRARSTQRYYAPRQYGYRGGYNGYGYARGYAQPYYGAYGPAIGIGVGPFGVGVF